MNGARGAASGEVLTAPPSFASLFADVRDAYTELEYALEHHETHWANEAARCWWLSLKRLRAVS